MTESGTMEEITNEKRREKIPLMRMTSQISEMGKRMRRLYTSTVSIPAVYTEHKHEQYGTVKNYIRKVAGIPFAALYGFLLVWIISDLIIGKPGANFQSDSGLETMTAKNICAAIMAESYNETELTSLATWTPISSTVITTPPANGEERETLETLARWANGIITGTRESDSLTQSEKGILFENDSVELHGITWGVMGMLGVYSVFSRNIRATMLLILPGLVTRHSRHFIYTITLGMLMNGPVQSLKINFHKLLQNAGQTQRQSITKLCVTGLEFEKDAKKWHSFYLEQRERFCQFMPNVQCGSIPTRRPFKRFLESLNTGPVTKAIKEQASVVIEKVHTIGVYVDVARKVITVLSIIMLIVDAIRYLRSYYTDSSFDNKYVGRTARKYWEKRDYLQDWEDFSNTGWNDTDGLRHWEINKGFKTWNITKLTKKELFKVVKNSLTTFLFISFVFLVLGTDYFLAEAVQYIKDNVQLQGLNQNITTTMYLSPPHRTSQNLYWVITLLLLGAVVSCVFEVFMSRIRAKLCNLFYPDRAKERADYLYYNLVTGRIERQFHLLLLVRREVERRRKLVKFSPLQRLKEFFSNICPFESRRVSCTSCQWKVRYSKTRNLKFCVMDKKQTTKICMSCGLDVSINSDFIDGDTVMDKVIDGGCF